jgi:hypothetical protein
VLKLVTKHIAQSSVKMKFSYYRLLITLLGIIYIIPGIVAEYTEYDYDYVLYDEIEIPTSVDYFLEINGRINELARPVLKPIDHEKNLHRQYYGKRTHLNKIW